MSSSCVIATPRQNLLPFLLNCTDFVLQNGFTAQTYIMCGPRHLHMHKQEVMVMIKGNPAKQLQIAD